MNNPTTSVDVTNVKTTPHSAEQLQSIQQAQLENKIQLIEAPGIEARSLLRSIQISQNIVADIDEYMQSHLKFYVTGQVPYVLAGTVGGVTLFANTLPDQFKKPTRMQNRVALAAFVIAGARWFFGNDSGHRLAIEALLTTTSDNEILKMRDIHVRSIASDGRRLQELIQKHAK